MKRVLAWLGVVAMAGCASFAPRQPAVYFVFFDQGSNALTPQARKLVDSAAAAIKAAHPKIVAIGSGTDSGDNLALAEPRFGAIRDALVADGVDAALIARSALPQSAAPVTTATAATRAEIRLVTGN